MNYLKELRSHTPLTQEQLAQEIGVTKGTISAIERGKQLPNHVTLLKLAGYFAVDSNALWDRLSKPKVAHVGETVKIVRGRSRGYR